MSGVAVTRLLAGLAVLCLFAMGVLWSSGVKAQQKPCAPRAEIIKTLWKDYQEFIHAAGTINDRALMEVFISHKGTWTILVTMNGRTCIEAAGDNWDALPDQPKLPEGKGT